MWIFQLLAAWALLYFAFRLMIGIGGKRDNRNRDTNGEGSGYSYSDSGYLQNNPDVLRPEIESDEFDPTEYF